MVQTSTSIQLYLWDVSFLARCLCIWPVFNLAIETVRFCLRGWYILDVFLLLAFAHLRHEYQDLLSLWHGMHVCMCTQDLGLYSHPKEFWEKESEPMLTPRGKATPLEAQRWVEPVMLHHRGHQAQPTTDWAIADIALPIWRPEVQSPVLAHLQGEGRRLFQSSRLTLGQTC